MPLLKKDLPFSHYIYRGSNKWTTFYTFLKLIIGIKNKSYQLVNLLPIGDFFFLIAKWGNTQIATLHQLASDYHWPLLLGVKDKKLPNYNNSMDGRFKN